MEEQQEAKQLVTKPFVVVHENDVKLVRRCKVTAKALEGVKQVVLPLGEGVEIQANEIDDAQRAKLAPYFVTQ